MTEPTTDGDLAPNDFAMLLRRFRMRRRLTQEELANEAGLSVRAVRNAELGLVDRPRRSSVLRLAAALGLDATGYRELDDAARGRPRESAVGPDAGGHTAAAVDVIGGADVTVLSPDGRAGEPPPNVVLVVYGPHPDEDTVEVTTGRSRPEGNPVVRISVHHDSEGETPDDDEA
jgi:transcriptional regulator with XRE-family HTH domain